MKRAFANAALAIVALGVSFAMCEGVVRLLYKDGTVLFPRYHTAYQYGPYRLRGITPNADFWHTSADGSWRFVTNSKGFRNEREFAYAKEPGTVRVLSLGDSHTQGYEVRQQATFSAVAERTLERHGFKAEVLNAGVSGFSNAEQLAFLENEGLRYQPDAVVLAFSDNDFSDNLKAGLFRLEGESKLVAEKLEHLPGVGLQKAIYGFPATRWLSENSYFYSLLFNNVWQFFKDQLARRSAAGHGGAPAHAFEYAKAIGSGPTPYEIALAAALVERMHRLCSERGIRFIVVDIPARTAAVPVIASVPAALAERLQRSGIDLIRSESLFALPVERPVHVAHGQGHISEFAHAVIGTEIANRLAAGLTPAARFAPQAACSGKHCK